MDYIMILEDKNRNVMAKLNRNCFNKDTTLSDLKRIFDYKYIKLVKERR